MKSIGLEIRLPGRVPFVWWETVKTDSRILNWDYPPFSFNCHRKTDFRPSEPKYPGSSTQGTRASITALDHRDALPMASAPSARDSGWQGSCWNVSKKPSIAWKIWKHCWQPRFFHTAREGWCTWWRIFLYRDLKLNNLRMMPIYSLFQKTCIHRGQYQAKKGTLLLFLLFWWLVLRSMN